MLSWLTVKTCGLNCLSSNSFHSVVPCVSQKFIEQPEFRPSGARAKIRAGDWGIGQALALRKRLGHGRRKPVESLDPAACLSGHRHRTQSCRLALASFLPWKMHTEPERFTFPCLYGILPSCGRYGCNGNKYWPSLNWRLLLWVTYAPWIACGFYGVFSFHFHGKVILKYFCSDVTFALVYLIKHMQINREYPQSKWYIQANTQWGTLEILLCDLYRNSCDGHWPWDVTTKGISLTGIAWLMCACVGGCVPPTWHLEHAFQKTPKLNLWECRTFVHSHNARNSFNGDEWLLV